MPSTPVRRRPINARAARQSARALLSTLPTILGAEPHHPDAALLHAAARFHALAVEIEGIFHESITLHAEKDRTKAIIPIERQADRECLIVAATSPKTIIGHRARAAMLALMDETLVLPSGQLSQHFAAILITDLLNEV